MSKEKIVKGVGDLKSQATKLGGDAMKAAGTMKTVVQTGIGASKSVIQKAGEVLNKKQLGQGIDTASKGLDFVAKGIRMASKGTEVLASTVEKASSSIKKTKNKL